MRTLRLLAVPLLLALVGPALAAGALAAPAAHGVECAIDPFPEDTIEIMAPAAPGGGWDTTAREMAVVLQDHVLEGDGAEVFNVEGAGGTVGLAQLVNDEAGNQHQLMMMGLVMIGAIATNQSEVTLDDVTPIARLTAEFEVIVVPADSEYQTLDDLVAAFQADPTAIAWGGGSAGGTDHILVGLLAQAVGVDPTQINYVPYSGGGEALAAIIGGQVDAGVSGVGEWIEQIESGELRALAVSGAAAPAAGGTPAAADASPAAAAGVAPTLKEQGIDLELANWRGVVAPPELSEDQTGCLVAMVEEMHASQAWQDVLAKYDWQDFFLTGEEYGAYLAEERDRVTPILQDLGLVEG
jgi:putative tricarboxylic transport membrane protein